MELFPSRNSQQLKNLLRVIFLGMTLVVSPASGSVVFNGLPDPNNLMLQLPVGTSLLIQSIFGGHFLQQVNAVPTNYRDATGVHTTYLIPGGVPLYQPYPYYDVNGNILFPQLSSDFDAGESNIHLVTGPSQLSFEADWNVIFSSQPQFIFAMDLDFVVTNEPATLEASGNYLLMLYDGDFINRNSYHSSPLSLTLPPGHYQGSFTIIDPASSGNASLSIVPETSSLFLIGCVGMITLSTCFVRRTNLVGRSHQTRCG
jgi:hypothetical protein